MTLLSAITWLPHIAIPEARHKCTRELSFADVEISSVFLIDSHQRPLVKEELEGETYQLVQLAPTKVTNRIY
jgi:hypothetical protein